MANVKYIGTCDKTDSIVGVGLRWTPGQVRNVSDTVAALLCAFADTWVQAGAAPKQDEEIDLKKPDEEIGLKPVAKEADVPLPVVDFHSMSKQQMIEFAQTKMNIRIDKNLSEANVRHKVTDAFAYHHLEQDKAAGLK